MNSGRHTSAHARKHGLQTANQYGSQAQPIRVTMLSNILRVQVICTSLLNQEAYRWAVENRVLMCIGYSVMAKVQALGLVKV